MKRLVDGFALVVVLFFGAGYLVSQIRYSQGQASLHAALMDQPSIRMLSTLLFVSAIALFFVEADPPEESA